MKQTPLRETHESLGAGFGDHAGWNMPASYGDAHMEYGAARTGAAVCDLSHRGKLKMSGKEHIKFIQGMVSNEVDKLEVQRSVYATLLTPKGRMITDMTIHKFEGFLLIDLEPGMNEKVGEMLKKYRLSYKADIDDVTQQLSLIHLTGPEAPGIIEEVFGKDASGLTDQGAIEAVIEAARGGADVVIAAANRTGLAGYDIYAPNEAASTLWQALTEAGAVPMGLDSVETLRIEAAIPLYGVDMTEETIPLEAGLDHAVNYDKGCYVGQEVVARIHWRGHVNRHIVGFEIDGESVPDSGTKLTVGEKEVGWLTSSVYSPTLSKVIALGYIRREHVEPGTEAVLNEDGSTRTAKVVSTPFVSSD